MLTVQKGSWHYRLATTYGPMFDGHVDQTDLCSYFWACIRGLLFAAIVVVVGAFVGFFLVMVPAIQLVALVFEGVSWWLDWWATLLYVAVTILVILAAAILGLYRAFSVVSVRAKGTSAAQIIATRYDDWKSRHCSLVQILD